MTVSMEKKVVVHYCGGKLVKGYLFDFNQDKDTFHIFTDHDQTDMVEISQNKLKAVFFVKSFEGDSEYRCPDICEDDVKCLPGMKLKITFMDGESMFATTYGYSPARKGFFVSPYDKKDNNESIYVVSSSTVAIDIIR